MTRDYANRSESRKKKSQSYLKLWLFVLFLFATFTIGLVYLGKQRQQQATNTNTTKPTPKTKIKAAKKKTSPQKIIKEVITPKFDFYTILPQRKNNNSISEYIIDVALVKDDVAADHLKAELALLGFTVNVKPILKNGAKQYLVTTGPYDNKDGAMSDLERLKQSKISGELKKIK